MTSAGGGVGLEVGDGAMLDYLSEADATTDSGTYQELFLFGP